jgi:hypothetical protein
MSHRFVSEARSRSRRVVTEQKVTTTHQIGLAYCSMPTKLDKAAEVVGEAVGTLETAAAAAGSRVKQGLSEAATAISGSKSADRVEKSTRPLRKSAAKKAKSIKRATKKEAAVVKRKAAGAKKTAKKRATGARKTAAKRATVTKKAAKKQASVAKRKVSGATKTAKKRATGAKKTAAKKARATKKVAKRQVAKRRN